MGGQKRLGDLLVEMKFIDEAQLKAALEEQRRSGRRLGRILCETGKISEARLVRALARQLGLETCSPLSTSVHGRVKSLIPADVAIRFHVLPLAVSKDNTAQTLFVATSDPLDTAALEAIRTHVGLGVRIRWMIAPETELDLALARHYGTEASGLPGAPAHFPPSGEMAAGARGRTSAAIEIGSAPGVDEESFEVVPLANTMLSDHEFRPRPPGSAAPSGTAQHGHGGPPGGALVSGAYERLVPGTPDLPRGFEGTGSAPAASFVPPGGNFSGAPGEPVDVFDAAMASYEASARAVPPNAGRLMGTRTPLPMMRGSVAAGPGAPGAPHGVATAPVAPMTSGSIATAPLSSAGLAPGMPGASGKSGWPGDGSGLRPRATPPPPVGLGAGSIATAPLTTGPLPPSAGSKPVPTLPPIPITTGTIPPIPMTSGMGPPAGVATAPYQTGTLPGPSTAFAPASAAGPEGAPLPYETPAFRPPAHSGAAAPASGGPVPVLPLSSAGTGTAVPAKTGWPSADDVAAQSANRGPGTSPPATMASGAGASSVAPPPAVLPSAPQPAVSPAPDGGGSLLGQTVSSVSSWADLVGARTGAFAVQPPALIGASPPLPPGDIEEPVLELEAVDEIEELELDESAVEGDERTVDPSASAAAVPPSAPDTPPAPPGDEPVPESEAAGPALAADSSEGGSSFDGSTEVFDIHQMQSMNLLPQGDAGGARSDAVAVTDALAEEVRAVVAAASATLPEVDEPALASDPAGSISIEDPLECEGVVGGPGEHAGAAAAGSIELADALSMEPEVEASEAPAGGGNSAAGFMVVGGTAHDTPFAEVEVTDMTSSIDLERLDGADPDPFPEEFLIPRAGDTGAARPRNALSDDLAVPMPAEDASGAARQPASATASAPPAAAPVVVGASHGPAPVGLASETGWHQALEDAASVDVLPPLESEISGDEAGWAAEVQPALPPPPPPAPRSPSASTEVPSASARIAADAERVRVGLREFASGRDIDPETGTLILRAIAGILLNEGLMEGERLERALEAMAPPES